MTNLEVPGGAFPRRSRPMIVDAAGFVVGLLLYAYLAGWVVEVVRSAAARIPASAVTDALSARDLMAGGLQSTLLTAAVFAASCAAAWLSSRRNWDVHGQDWHDIVRKGGVDNARNADGVGLERRRRERRQATMRAERAARVAGQLRTRRLGLLARVAERLHARANERAAGIPDDAQPQDLQPAPLGDWAVRVIAGFNIMVLSALIALAAGRAAGVAVPHVRWPGVVVAVLVFCAVRWLLTRASPLALNSRTHAVIWGIVSLATLFASAPIGVLMLTTVGISTLGRRVARLPQPRSAEQFLRSPVPWILLIVCLLVGLAYNATPPVSFPRAVVTTAAGARTGGYVTRTNAGVYLVTCTALANATSSEERVDLVPADTVRDVQVGGGTDYLDSGERPSLAALALDALGLGGSPPTLFSPALRATQPTCDGAERANPSIGHEAPALGAGVIAGPAPAAGRAHDGEAPIADTTAPAIAALARRYQPTLLVSAADRNWPVSVNAVLAERGPDGQPVCLVQTRAPHHVCAPTPSDLAGAGVTPSDYLQLPVALRDDQSPNGQFQAFLKGEYQTSGSVDAWLADPGGLDPWYTAQIYFYYAGPLKSSAFPARPRNPDVPSGLIGLEYWFFYPYNYYPLLVNADLMNQAPLAGDTYNVDLHQGDWEHADVLLNPKTLTPEWIYLARHSDEGQFIPWSSPELSFDAGHPVLQAAFGGHPTYLPGCGAAPRAATDDLSSDWLSCGSGRFAFRAATTPLVDIADTAWACWPGHFGEATSLEVNAAKQPESTIDSVKHFVFVAGPQSPLQQAENTGVCARNGGGNPRQTEITAVTSGPLKSASSMPAPQ